MAEERLMEIISFLETIDKLKSIHRATYLTDNSRNEDDAAHTWHMCMYAIMLHKELDVEVDITHTLELILVHDLVEIYAGDTFAYGTEGQDDKKEREEAAAQKLFSQLPQDLYGKLYGLWQEFEDASSPEARYARSLDRLQAFAQNVFTGGRLWRERDISEEMTRERNHEGIYFDGKLNEAFELLYDRARGLWPEDSQKGT